MSTWKTSRKSSRSTRRTSPFGVVGPLAPCEEPTGLAIDAKNRRLFSVCQNKILAITDANSGKVIATAAIGEGPDAAVFDPDTQLAFASNGDSGTLTIIHEDSHNKFRVVENVPTKENARMAIDLRTHNIFCPPPIYDHRRKDIAAVAVPRQRKWPPKRRFLWGVRLSWSFRPLTPFYRTPRTSFGEQDCLPDFTTHHVERFVQQRPSGPPRNSWITPNRKTLQT